MIVPFFMAGYQVAVLGLGKSGIATAKALLAAGATVLAWDDKPEARAAAAAAGVPIHDLMQADWDEIVSLIQSPGIPHTHPAPHPVSVKARAAGVEIVGDIELLVRTQREASFVGITGTNGKSTTTALIGHILELSGRDIAVGGNLGTPVLTLPPLKRDGLYVLEMSSYQLELTPSVVFDAAVLLNITPDHLDRHGGMDGYIAAKRRIFQRQAAPRAAIVGIDDAITRGIADALSAEDNGPRVIRISAVTPAPGGVYAADGMLIDDLDGRALPVLSLADVPALPGRHNAQNIAAAYAACRAVGVDPVVAAACIRSFPGLAHRQEKVGDIGGVTFINDSKATNAEATERALVCYHGIHWIVGGKAKEGGIEALRPFFDRVRHAYLIGEAADAFAATIGTAIPVSQCGDLATATAAAAANAKPGEVVLLSPACASFDQFTSFEHRGDTFRALVADLATKGGAA